MRTITRRIGTALEAPPERRAQAEGAYRIDWDALRTAARACCCPARPVVIAVIPPSPGRAHKTDLLLCGHHFRLSRQALALAGATAFDGRGMVVALDAVADRALR